MLEVEDRVNHLDELIAQLIQTVERTSRGMWEFRQEMDRKWGELSNKLGIMAENLVAPSIPRVLKQVARCDSEINSAIRVRKTEPQNQEVGAVAVCGFY